MPPPTTPAGGYGAGAGPLPGPTHPSLVKPLRGLATATTVVSAVLALTQLALWATSWSAAADLVQMSRSRTDVLEGPLLAFDLVSIGYLLALLAAYVVSCSWLHRARGGSERISPHWPHARGSAWTWLGWWVPIVSLWFPYQVVRDVRAASLGHAWTSGGVGAWWTFWLCFVLVAQAASALVPTSGVPDAELARALPWVETVATFSMLVALVLWVRLVREITAAQSRAAGH